MVFCVCIYLYGEFILNEAFTYKPLPGKERGKKSFFAVLRTKASLFAGPDHLLSVFNSSYSEDYRRFYFKDIQAIIISRTSEQAKWNAIYGGICLALLLAAYMTGEYWAAAFIAFAAIFLVKLALNWLRGPTCVCRIYTAASRTELPSLARLKNAIKTLDIIKPLIERSQGRLSGEEIKAKMGHVTEETS
jgi:hypothetical protein